MEGGRGGESLLQYLSFFVCFFPSFPLLFPQHLFVKFFFFQVGKKERKKQEEGGRKKKKEKNRSPNDCCVLGERFLTPARRPSYNKEDGIPHFTGGVLVVMIYSMR